MSASQRIVVACALALLLLAPPFAVAQENGPLSLRLEPSTVSPSSGQAGTSTATVENDGLGPMTVALSVGNISGGLQVNLSDSEITVLPGAAEQITVSVRGTTVGNWSLTIIAQQENGLGANGTARATAVLRVNVAPPPANATGNGTAPTNATGSTPPPSPSPTPPAPTPAPSPTPSSPAPTGNATQGDAGANATPTASAPPAANATGAANESAPQPPAPAAPRANVTELRLAAVRGERAAFSVAIENPGPVAQHIDVTLRLPLGWGGTLDRSSFDVGALDRAVLRGAVTPNAQAEDAVGQLVFLGAGGTETVALQLLLLDAPVQVSSQGSQPAAIVDDPAIHEDVATAPPPTTLAPRDEETLLLRVEPAEIAAAPGTHVVLNLHIQNLGPTPVEGAALLQAAGLPLDVASPMFLAPARGETILTFIARIPEDAPQGARYDGVAAALGREATFVVRADSVDLATVPVAASAGDGGAPVVVIVAVAGAAAGAISLAALARKWPLLGLAPLYARLAPRRALEHPRRQQLVELLRQEPGATLADVQRKLGLSNGVARHHVQLLSAAGMVRVVQDGPLRRLYPTDAPRADPTPALRERALTAIRQRGEVRASELASELGVSRQALHYHLKKLEREGAIRAAREGTEVVLAAAS